jgi:hypothetical protein
VSGNVTVGPFLDEEREDGIFEMIILI